MEWTILFLPYIYIPVVTLALIGAILMTLATIFTKELGSSCHALICILCVFDSLHTFAQVPTIWTIFANKEIQVNCFYLELPGLIGNFAGLPLAFLLGIDRFIAVTDPIYYYSLRPHRNRYVKLLMIFPTIIVSMGLIFSYLHTSNALVYPCGVPQAKGPIVFRICNYLFLAFCIVIIAIYISVWKKAKKQMDTGNCRLFRPTITVVLLLITGWMPEATLSLVAPLFAPSHTIEDLQLFAGIFVNIACASNIVVYFPASKDHNKAIKGLFRFVKTDNKIGVVNNIDLKSATNSGSANIQIYRSPPESSRK